MKALLFILLGLSLGIGLTLIAIQERFLRERRRLLALGESQRAKATQALDEQNKKWAQECQQYKDELSACKEQLTKREVPTLSSPEDPIHKNEHDRLIQEKNSELSRLATEIRGAAELLGGRQEEINDLQGQIAFLQGEVTRLEEAPREKTLPNDDFVLLGNTNGHLLPGSVVRALIKGRKEAPHSASGSDLS
ncbi:MAG: hypothetical protein Q8J76_01950 [Desulfobulbaceae bacterium]|nr:hypothetical protein [Desulfobulbaceae bacterium]